MPKPRVFIGFGETSGYCAGLKKGFDEIGIPAVSFMIREHRSQFDETGCGWLLVSIRAVLKKRDALQARSAQTPSRAAKMGFALRCLGLAAVQNAVWLAVLVWAAAKFDVFILQGRASFINVFRFPVKPRFLDLILLKLLGKKIIYVFHGTDSRPAYLNGAVGTRRLDAKQLVRYVRRQARDIRIIEKHAHAILHYPLNTHLHRKRIISHEFMGRPVYVDPPRMPADLAAARTAVRIVHAPTDPIGKGTATIRACIGRLAQKGHAIEFIELTGRKNAEVKDLIRSCDFVVDQLYYDVAISYLGTEAAVLGKATVIGTYAKEELGKTMPEPALPPAYLCAPEEMEQAIEKLLRDSALRGQLGRQARVYAENHAGPKRVAENFLRVISDDVPEAWLFDPKSLNYCHGYGYSKDELKEVIRGFVQEGGPGALHLDDKPALKQQILQMNVADASSNSSRGGKAVSAGRPS